MVSNTGCGEKPRDEALIGMQKIQQEENRSIKTENALRAPDLALWMDRGN